MTPLSRSNKMLNPQHMLGALLRSSGPRARRLRHIAQRHWQIARSALKRGQISVVALSTIAQIISPLD
jgi:hypothetical protein